MGGGSSRDAYSGPATVDHLQNLPWGGSEERQALTGQIGGLNPRGRERLTAGYFPSRTARHGLA